MQVWSGPHAKGARIEVEFWPGRSPTYSAIVALAGEHDIATAGDVRATLAAIDGDVLLDLTRCTFLESSVIHAVADDARARRREWQTLELVVPPDNANVLRALHLSGLSELLFVHTPAGPGGRH